MGHNVKLFIPSSSLKYSSKSHFENLECPKDLEGLTTNM